MTMLRGLKLDCYHLTRGMIDKTKTIAWLPLECLVSTFHKEITLVSKNANWPSPDCMANNTQRGTSLWQWVKFEGNKQYNKASGIASLETVNLIEWNTSVVTKDQIIECRVKTINQLKQTRNTKDSWLPDQATSQFSGSEKGRQIKQGKYWKEIIVS